MFGLSRFKKAPLKKSAIDKKLKASMVALVVGHNSNSQGAVNYLGESEYTFNKRIAHKVMELLRANLIECAIIERPVAPYGQQVVAVGKRVKEIGADFSFHLHFNSSTGRAKGCEVVIADDNIWAASYADYITDEIHKHLNISERHKTGVLVVGKGDRGYSMLKYMMLQGCTPMIIEPCFSHYRFHDSIKIFENEDKYAEVLSNCIYSIARGEIGGLK